jgi:hypothetical protein
LEKQKTDAAAYVSADSVGHFLFFLERKEWVAVAVVGLESLRVSFLFCRLVRSIHPVDVWTKDESFFHPPSSTAGIVPNSWGVSVSVWNSYFVCNPCPYLSRVQVDVDVGSGSRCEKRCQCIRWCHY